MAHDSPLPTPDSDSSYDVDDIGYYDDARPRRIPVFAVAAWLTILVVVVGIAGLVSFSQFMTPASYEMSSGELIGVNLSAKMMVGFRQGTEPALQQIAQFETGPLEQRYSHAIMLNEIAGAEKAIDRLRIIDKAVEREITSRKEAGDDIEFPTESQRNIRRILGHLFEQYHAGDYDSATLPQADKDLLENKLGWVGKLSLTPGESPNKADRKKITDAGRRAFIILMVATVFGLLAVVAAFVAVAALIALCVSRQMAVRFQDQTQHGFVYLETFAIWLILFVGLQTICQIVAAFFESDRVALALSPLAFFGSLLVLIWPLYRGIPFSTLRRDIGWEIRNPFAELFVGGFSYLALIVPMIFGISISVLLGLGMSLVISTGEFQSTGPAGHPIAEEIASGNPVVWILVFVTACIAAPIVEETMFRGVLYRYLRDTTGDNKSQWISIAVSSVVGGLIFAMIHPQGLIGIPILTVLAVGFSLVREWRNSLIGPITMHAINNGIVTCLLLSLMV